MYEYSFVKVCWTVNRMRTTIPQTASSSCVYFNCFMFIISGEVWTPIRSILHTASMKSKLIRQGSDSEIAQMMEDSSPCSLIAPSAFHSSNDS